MPSTDSCLARLRESQVLVMHVPESGAREQLYTRLKQEFGRRRYFTGLWLREFGRYETRLPDKFSPINFGFLRPPPCGPQPRHNAVVVGAALHSYTAPDGRKSHVGRRVDFPDPLTCTILEAPPSGIFKKHQLRDYLDQQLRLRRHVNLLARGLDNRGVLLPNFAYKRIYEHLLLGASL